MLTYLEPAAFVAHRGLKITLVKDVPSPWCQAAKTLFEVKGLDYVAAHWLAGAPNPELSAWGGEPTSPVVGWQDEKPIHHWLDILYLAERLAPEPSLIPNDVMDRALMFGLCHEICGRLGIGWNRRLEIMAPTLAPNSPADARENGGKYGLNRADAEAASDRLAASLAALAAQLKSQKQKGSAYFIGDRLSALDIYWTAFSNIFDPLPDAQCPLPPAARAIYASMNETVSGAWEPILIEHRARIFAAHFHSPMEM